MADIVMADDGIAFNGASLDAGPLGGAESSFIELARALARLGHSVLACTAGTRALDLDGVAWRPIHAGVPYGGLPEQAACDLYIANRGDKLILRMPNAAASVFWVHNPARYLMKWRYLSKLARRRPPIVFLGASHLATYPRWAPGGERIAIPYGVPERFRAAPPADSPPAPRAVFTSNALRSLDWLLDLWAADIQPRVPGAQLHLFTGAATYGAVGAAKAQAMDSVLSQARALEGHGVVVRGAVGKAQLVDELRAARVMLYRGDINETFCLAVAEAQAMGVPAVVQNLGSVAERVRHGESGFVAADDRAFADAACRLLTDDGLWRSQHDAALRHARAWGWADAARAFEQFLPAARRADAAHRSHTPEKETSV
jgi:glycosyltransferase involved in cell wall biosynthesis